MTAAVFRGRHLAHDDDYLMAANYMYFEGPSVKNVDRLVGFM